jgi:YegS/Rv2252/BmrU family lipid kinase
MFIIINPASARGNARARWAQLEGVLRGAGVRFDVAMTQASSHATELAAQAAQRGHEVVACLGGDGTLNEVLNGLMTQAARPPLAIIPCGTGSDFARALKLPHAPQAVLALLQRGTPQAVDVGLVACRRNGQTVQRHFINIAGVGFDGDVSAHMSQSSKRGGSLAYVANVFNVLGRYENKQVTVTLKNGEHEQTIEGVFNSIVIANGQYFGGGMWVAPNASWQDGLLDVVLIGNVSRAEFVMTFPRIYRGTHLSHPKVSAFRATEVRIEPHPQEHAMLEAEGELFGAAPATVCVLPAACKVLTP